MAVPITWFLTFTCWISQKSADYMHNHAPSHSEKKSLSNTQIIESTTGTQVSFSEIKKIIDNPSFIKQTLIYNVFILLAAENCP